MKNIKITWVGHGDPLVFLVFEKKVLRMSLDMQTSPDYYLPIQIFDLIVLYLPNETHYLWHLKFQIPSYFRGLIERGQNKRPKGHRPNRPGLFVKDKKRTDKSQSIQWVATLKWSDDK